MTDELMASPNVAKIKVGCCSLKKQVKSQKRHAKYFIDYKLTLISNMWLFTWNCVVYKKKMNCC